MGHRHALWSAACALCMAQLPACGANSIASPYPAARANTPVEDESGLAGSAIPGKTGGGSIVGPGGGGGDPGDGNMPVGDGNLLVLGVGGLRGDDGRWVGRLEASRAEAGRVYVFWAEGGDDAPRAAEEGLLPPDDVAPDVAHDGPCFVTDLPMDMHWGRDASVMWSPCGAPSAPHGAASTWGRIQFSRPPADAQQPGDEAAAGRFEITCGTQRLAGSFLGGGQGAE